MKPLPQSVPSRVIIEGVEPEIDGGQFPSKRTVGEAVTIAADVYADGHEVLAAVLRYRHAPAAERVADVQAAVRWAQQHGVAIRARSGGHSYAGYSTVSGGLVVDLRRLRGIGLSRANTRAEIGAKLASE